MRIRRERAVMRRRAASIVKAATVRKSDELDRLVDDDLGGLNVGDRLWRRLIRLNYRRFLGHLRVGWRNCCGGTVRKTGAGNTPRSDLLIVQLRRREPGTAPLLPVNTRSAPREPVARGRVRLVQESARSSTISARSSFTGVATSSVASSRISVAGRGLGDSKRKNNRQAATPTRMPNWIATRCPLSDSFPHAPPGDNRDDGTKRVFLQPREIFFEISRQNNLKICEAVLNARWQRVVPRPPAVVRAPR